MRRWLMMIGLMVAAAGLAVSAAETFAVGGLPSAERIVIHYYRGLPVVFGLAHVEIPAEQAPTALAKLTSLLSSKKAEVQWLPSFGTAADGAALVHLRVGTIDVNEVLVAAGLARAIPGSAAEASYDALMTKAQANAKRAKAGLWGEAATVVAAVEKPPTPDAVAALGIAPTDDRSAKTTAKTTAKGPFCAELDGRYYYPSDSRAVTNIAAQRLIYYPDEATAKKAGKIAPTPTDALPTDTSENSGDTVLAKGKDIYAHAIAAGNTSARDQLYEQAYVYLTRAMQIFSALCEQYPNQAGLAEKLRVSMQLRYGSVKQRRFE